jgi:hypothetical protein
VAPEDLLTFAECVAAAPLSPADREVVAEVARGLEEPHLHEMAAFIRHPADRVDLAASRERWRGEVAVLPAFARLRPIIEAHDPTVLASPDGTLLTARSLAVLEEAVAWVLDLLGGPPPPTGFGEALRARLRRDWASFTPELHDGLGRIERNWAAERAWWAMLPQADRARWLAENRGRATDAEALVPDVVLLLRSSQRRYAEARARGATALGGRLLPQISHDTWNWVHGFGY